MSRIGNKAIEIPQNVEVKINENKLITVKGPKGELSKTIDPDLSVKIENNKIIVNRHTEQKKHKSKHGLYRQLIANMIEGVTNGFKKELELVGVGYRVTVQGQLIDLALGYSHNILFQIPKEIKVTAKTEKGKNPVIILESNNKELIGLVAAKIRSLRKPEPYKGKGIRYIGEQIRRKAGKSASK